MARDTMVVNVTRSRQGFTVSDASREWELAVFVTHWQSGSSGWTVVLTEVDGCCCAKSGSVLPEEQKDFTQKISRAIKRICHHWQDSEREILQHIVRRHLERAGE